MTRIDLLTPRNLAEQLKCSLATLKRWRRRGEGPPWFNLGTGVRYATTDVERWLRGHRSSTAPRVKKLMSPPIKDTTSKVLSFCREGFDSSK